MFNSVFCAAVWKSPEAFAFLREIRVVQVILKQDGVLQKTAGDLHRVDAAH